MPFNVKDSGTWSSANSVYIKSGADWKRAKRISIKDAGVWKTVQVRELEITLTANTAEYNIQAAAIAAGWDQKNPLFANVVIQSGVVVFGSNSNTQLSYAMTTGYGWPVGSRVEIHNSGTIVGKGGNGGAGGGTFFIFGGFPEDGYPGERGGTALIAGVPVTMYNYGRLAGGGGGGGGGSAVGVGSTGFFGYNEVDGGSGGGGGRSGIANSSGGLGGSGTGGAGTTGNRGGNGTFVIQGSGGTAVGSGRAGGAGGSWGNTGISGSGGALGGPGGYYVQGNSNVTFVITGTRNGLVI